MSECEPSASRPWGNAEERASISITRVQPPLRSCLAPASGGGSPRALGFSKELAYHKAAAVWDDLVYNLARPLKSLRQWVAGASKWRWRLRMPAMVAGLADRLWSMADIVRAVPVPI